MTTTAPAPQGTLDLSRAKRTGFGTLLKVELRKSVDTRAGLWLLIVTGLFALGVMGVVVAVGVSEDLPLDFGTFLASTTYSTSILLPVLGIMLVTSEWNQRTAMVTFVLEPRRSLVILAKIVAGLVLAVVVALVAALAAVLCNLAYAGLSGSAVSWDLGSTSVSGFLVLQGIAMLSGFALAMLFLNTPTAIVVFFVYTFVLPAVFAIGAALVGWIRDLQPWIDFANAQTPLFDWSMEGQVGPVLAVSGTVWLVLPFAVGLWRVLRAEVK